MSELHFRAATEQDIDRCYLIETSSYGGSQAASKEKIFKRITTYPQGFIVLEKERQIVGFINAGACFNVQLSDDDFKQMLGHDPTGDKIVIMSVVVHPDYQRQGLANIMLTNFIKQIKTLNKTEIHLMCETALVPLYAGHGFIELGISASNYAGLKWHEMSLTL